MTQLPAPAARGSRLPLFLRAYPTLLRIGVLEAVAYRAELVVWMLTMTMPLVSLVLWSSAAAGTTLGAERLSGADLTAYFLLTLFVRMITSSWVLWQITDEIRTGSLAQRLLKPISPFALYTAEQLAAVPLRAALALPLVVILLGISARSQLTHEPSLWVAAILSLPAAWALNFLSMAIIGMLAFYIESALGLFYAWLGLFTLFSGYLVPLSLMPPWLRGLAAVLPFRYQLDVPVKIVLGWPDASQGGARDTAAGIALAYQHLGIQYAYVLVLSVAAALLWRAGLRRFAAFGS
jgi:ABC-2 type transport system permease protein